MPERIEFEIEVSDTALMKVGLEECPGDIWLLWHIGYGCKPEQIGLHIGWPHISWIRSQALSFDKKLQE